MRKVTRASRRIQAVTLTQFRFKVTQFSSVTHSLSREVKAMTVSDVNKHLRVELASDRLFTAHRHVPLRRFSFILVWIVLLVANTVGFGQASGGQIAGSVTDVSGAVLSGAKVTAVNERSGSSYSTVTSTAGEFHFPTLQVGSYTVMVAAQGFEAEQSTGVLVEIDKTAALNLTLRPGSTQQTVTVNADALRVESESVDSS